MPGPFAAICYAYSGNGYHRTQWLCNVTAYALDAAYERGLTPDVPNPEGVIAVATAADLPADCELVVMSPETARYIQPTVTLQEFVHPDRAVYFFGADTIFLSDDDLGGRQPDHVVCAPNVSPRESDELYSFVVGAVVLYDRLVKRG